MTVAENIKRLRKNRGFTQKQLAEKCGMSESTLRQYEIGYRNPKIETLHKIAKALDKSIILLVEGCEDKYPLSGTDYQIDSENTMTDDEKKRYYLNKETAKTAQEIFENKELRMLFDVAKDADPEDLKALHNMALALKRKERGNNDDTGC